MHCFGCFFVMKMQDQVKMIKIATILFSHYVSAFLQVNFAVEKCLSIDDFLCSITMCGSGVKLFYPCFCEEHILSLFLSSWCKLVYHLP